ncbi:cytochrome P450 [Streptomyces sp. NRRL S-237]|uniref:cytochrome P450 n=1 Tax=Streptomyces sp. NRRL S-237 TaxID=1463895 RepID=UPI00099D578E|nr:cytochrome P450 [Streptomyces sp. NRRL S-237]
MLHRNPALFPEPDRFDPDRWLPERAETVPRGAMIPLGAGNRQCIGDTFGTTEAPLALATTFASRQLLPEYGTPIRPKAQMGLGTGPLLMRTEATTKGCAGPPRRTPRTGWPGGRPADPPPADLDGLGRGRQAVREAP